MKCDMHFITVPFSGMILRFEAWGMLFCGLKRA